VAHTTQMAEMSLLTKTGRRKGKAAYYQKNSTSLILAGKVTNQLLSIPKNG
jgi:hypothetical protein